MAEFVMGFKDLADLIPDIVGVPLENERHDSPNGDGLQATLMPSGARGLMVWRKSDNWTAFTDGYRTWINGPQGLQERLNSERFDWELPQPKPVLVRDIIALLPVATWNACPTRNTAGIKLIGVHWDGGPSPIPEGYDPLEWYRWEARYHIAKNWGSAAKPAYGYGLMYAEKISRDGRVWLTRPAQHIVWAANGANPMGYHLCLDANEFSPPTPAQLASLEARLDHNRLRFSVARSAVWGHGELTQFGNATACPGPGVQARVTAYRQAEAA